MASMLVTSNLNALVDFIQVIHRVWRFNDLNAFVDYGSGAIMCNLFFLAIVMQDIIVFKFLVEYEYSKLIYPT